MLMLKQDTIKKRQANKLLESEIKFEARDNKEYKLKLIINSVLYGKEIESQILNFYYLVL